MLSYSCRDSQGPIHHVMFRCTLGHDSVQIVKKLMSNIISQEVFHRYKYPYHKIRKFEYQNYCWFTQHMETTRLIWVKVDCMAKSNYFVLVMVSYSVEDYAKLYLREMLSFHQGLLSIISTRGSQFTSQ